MKSRSDRLATVADVTHPDRQTQPVHVPWDRRAKSVHPMPGGVNNYLESLRWTADQIQRAEVSPGALATQMVDHYDVSPKYAELSIGFLRRAGLLGVQSGVCSLPHVTRVWQRDDDPTPLVVALHHGVQFIGEMLALLNAPMMTSDLLRCSNERYRMGWKSTGQVGFRAAWLRSARFVELDQRLLYRTDAGTAFLDLVVVEPALDDRPVGSSAPKEDAGLLGGAGHRLAEHQSSGVAHERWEDRASGVQPMTGGYDRFFDSLRWLAESVRDIPPHRAEIIARVARGLKVSQKSAASKVGFLQKVEFLQVEAEVWILADLLKSWLLDEDPIPLVVQLHRRIKFIGEMLEALSKPMKIEELRQLACEQYLMNWQTNTQIDNRRGWLQSAGLVGFDTSERLLYRTDAGSAFLQLVAVEPPLKTDSGVPQDHVASAVGNDQLGEAPRASTTTVAAGRDVQRREPAAVLANRIIDASTDSDNPMRFESVVRDAFQFLGFETELLGGSGQTDVLVNAPLGLGASYRVAIDVKTAGSGRLTDQQVDWITLKEHRSQHSVDYFMLIGPNPAGGRLFNRAKEQVVAVLSASALADLCRMHAVRPLGLADYRRLFESGGGVDLAAVESRSDQAGSRAALAKLLLDTIREDAERFGRVTARDLYRALVRDQSAFITTEAEIHALLESLASPLVGAIQGDPDNGYVLACLPTVTAERLRILGQVLLGASTEESLDILRDDELMESLRRSRREADNGQRMRLQDHL